MWVLSPSLIGCVGSRLAAPSQPGLYKNAGRPPHLKSNSPFPISNCCIQTGRVRERRAPKRAPRARPVPVPGPTAMVRQKITVTALCQAAEAILNVAAGRRIASVESLEVRHASAMAELLRYSTPVAAGRSTPTVASRPSPPPTPFSSSCWTLSFLSSSPAPETPPPSACWIATLGACSGTPTPSAGPSGSSTSPSLLAHRPTPVAATNGENRAPQSSTGGVTVEVAPPAIPRPNLHAQLTHYRSHGVRWITSTASSSSSSLGGW